MILVVVVVSAQKYKFGTHVDVSHSCSSVVSHPPVRRAGEEEAKPARRRIILAEHLHHHHCEVIINAYTSQKPYTRTHLRYARQQRPPELPHAVDKSQRRPAQHHFVAMGLEAKARRGQHPVDPVERARLAANDLLYMH